MEEIKSIKIEGKIAKTKERNVGDFKGYKLITLYLTKEWLYLGQPDRFKIMFVEDKLGEKYIVLKPIKE